MRTQNTKQTYAEVLSDGTACLSLEVLDDSLDEDTKLGVPAGAVVTGWKLDLQLWVSGLHPLRGLLHGKLYVIVTEDGASIVEVADYRHKGGVLVCSYLNPDKVAYPDFVIPVNEVREVYRVRSITKMCGSEDSKALQS